jgi:acyl phosphate:glycerol-3-phosphate acyltransferase
VSLGSAGILLVAAVVGYAVGSLSPATWIARARGVELAAEGSGNPGATNTGRLLGARFGVLVFILDLLKGFIPTLAFLLWQGEVAGLVAGFAAVLGHVTSPLLRGHGGRGVATAFGALLAAASPTALAALVVFVVVALVTRWIALASVLAAWTVAVAAVAAEVARPESTDEALVAFSLAIAAVILWRHRDSLSDGWARARRGRSKG